MENMNTKNTQNASAPAVDGKKLIELQNTIYEQLDGLSPLIAIVKKANVALAYENSKAKTPIEKVKLYKVPRTFYTPPVANKEEKELPYKVELKLIKKVSTLCITYKGFGYYATANNTGKITLTKAFQDRRYDKESLKTIDTMERAVTKYFQTVGLISNGKNTSMSFESLLTKLKRALDSEIVNGLALVKAIETVEGKDK